jgi:thiamine-phosphate pyrophosphorylase
MKWDLRKQLALYLVLGGAPNQHGRSAIEIARSALAGGVSVVQWRDKTHPLKQALPVAARIRDACRQHGVPFIVNDRIDLAMLLDADGVHLGQDDVPLREARRLLGSERLIGISVGTFEEALEAAEHGADYLGVGAIFATATKQDAGAPIGTALLARIAAELPVAQVGIGGIQASNAAEVLRAGAHGVAVVSAITEAADVQQAAQTLRAITNRGLE